LVAWHPSKAGAEFTELEQISMKWKLMANDYAGSRFGQD
jgi:hypothetical protein